MCCQGRIRTSLSYCLARHGGDNLPVQFSEVFSLAGFSTSLYFQMTISPCLVNNVGERPGVALGPLSIFASTWLMIRMFVLTRTCIFGESSEYVSIVSGYTPWLSWSLLSLRRPRAHPSNLIFSIWSSAKNSCTI